MTSELKPFWRYYGSKWRAAPRYPKPRFSTIVEPFASAAGYACRYPDQNVILVDSYAVICEIWRYLIATPFYEILQIPEVEHVDDLPGWVPEGARLLVGFWMNAATVSPRKQLSSGRKKLRAKGRKFEGWTEATKVRVASQVDRIRHWRVIEGDWSCAPDIEATWFVDPPYNNAAGAHYVHGPHDVDFDALAEWCKNRNGQTIVCENEGATWLPFQPFATLKPGVNNHRGGSREVIWTGGVTP